MTDEAMSPLRRRMIEDMTIRKLSPKTQQGYIRTIRDFAAFLGRSPGTASFAVAFQTRFPDHRRLRGIARLARRRTVEQDRVAAAISEVDGEADHQPDEETQPSLPRQEHISRTEKAMPRIGTSRHAGCAERVGDLRVALAQIDHRAADQHEGEQRADADHFTEDIDGGQRRDDRPR